MRDQILEYYKILLDFGWLEVDDEGFVSSRIGDQLVPAILDGKRLVLPTRGQMKIPGWDNRLGFHPIRESFRAGISDVTAALRDQFVQRLNASISYFMKELIAIAYDQDGQKNLTTEQAQVLNALKLADKTLVRDFDSILKNTKSRNNADQFMNLHIRRGGVVKGRTYGRAGIVVFPIYEKLVKEPDEKINGVKLSGKNREQLISLFEFIFPTIKDDPESLSVGVDSLSAPFLESLVRASLNVAKQLAEASLPYMDKVDMPALIQFPENLDVWKDIFDSKDKVEQLARVIPPLNTGEDANLEEENREETRKDDKKASPPWEETRDEKPSAPTPASDPRSNITRSSSGRMILGAPVAGNVAGKARLDQEGNAGSDRANRNDREVRRESSSEDDRARRELEDRERRLKEREEELDRRRREEERRESRERDRERDHDDRDRRDRDYDRRDRDYRDRDRRDRDYDRDDRRRESSGDPFEDNPTLRRALRDEEDDGRRGRYRDRGYDDRNDRYDSRGIRRDRYRDDDRRDRRDRYYRR